MALPGWFLAGLVLGPPTLPPPPGQGAAADPGAAPVADVHQPPSETAGVGVSVPPPERPPDPTPTAAPPSGPPRASATRRAPLSLPRGVEEDAPPWPRLPKPRRPPYDGVGLFVGAGVAFTAALTEQIISHVLVKRRCIEPLARRLNEPVDDPEEADLLGEAVLDCIPSVLPAIALRVNSDLALAASVGMVAAGTLLRGERDAYDHVFSGRHRNDLARLRGVGIGLIAGGAVTWLTLSPTAWAVLAKCTTARCAGGARAMGFSVRSGGAALVAMGAGLLGYSESYRRNHDRYARDRVWTVAPQLGPGLAGIGISGNF